jgi:lipid II:glycine glycyltransferase (peptidoglycan interpeptide bridge formation enzyme)
MQTIAGTSFQSSLGEALSQADREAYDAFLAASPHAAYQQARAWPDAVPRRGRHSFLYYLARSEGRVTAAAVIRKTRLTPWHALASVPRGPVVSDASILACVLEDLMDQLRLQGCVTLLAGPRMEGGEREEVSRTLAGLGFQPLDAERQPLHVATGIIDLVPREEEILAGFKQRARRQIRACIKAGVTVRRARGAADLAAYQAVLDRFAEQHGDYDMGGQPDARGQAALIEQLGGAILLSEREGEVIGGHAFVRQGSRAIWLSLATIREEPPIPRSYLLLWEGMRAAREMGCTGYDLAGLVEAPKDAGQAGREQFKIAFTPDRMELLPMHVAALKPLEHRLFFSARQAWRARRAAG